MIRILSIDDSRSVHAYLDVIFKARPCEIVHAYSGEEGLKFLLNTPPGAFDLILLDWEMPKLTGLETLKRIRESGSTVPVIMLTSKNEPESIASALAMGANEYVMKPFTADIVLERLDLVLEKKVA